MREKIKSIVLLCLVGVSVYLTYTLWISFPQKEMSLESKKSTNSEVDLFRIIRPQYAFLIEGGKTYLASVDNLWRQVVEFLNKEKEIKFTLEGKKDSGNSLTFEGIKFVIEKGWNKGVLKQILTRESVIRKLDDNARINQVLVDFKQNQVVFEDVYSNKRYVFSYESIKDLKPLSTEDATVCDSVYGIPLTAVFMPNIHNKTMIKELDQILLDKIFTNISIVRKVTEDNGKTVYTDGMKSLKIFEDGCIEFYSTSIESSSDGKLDFVKSAEFLERLGLNWRNFYLADVKEDNGQVSFFFGYSFDFPIWFDKRDFHPIEVTVSNGSVKSARILYLNVEEKGKITFSPEKMRNLFNAGLKISKNKGAFQAFRIGYIYMNGHFIPSIKMEFEKGSVFINMLNGKLLSIGE
ncbi:regulatory protein YycH of two-component signal transduction system YycFG [Caldanaerobacter subterraneus subsp. tengcongensis MB4]|uniref:Regulatory protein YycH domain-containing protein n=1 Tax=Caldanaerobacter subterraneus subsp. tengcongensis (strain DSM 15242 / JCM 11007 / NBRC 100824 / MB4) TaxID=273068 RepID=Q8R6U8_CALS4|nr:two-component system activity regulator YycH [Caldanaerobacter subterraneus]AAM25805.1 hypothetical protein TTE2686 [Caldanaerobacter subterraneus subsp. tengcongensis MB4]MCS3917324.1 regulatory protein YycH of two-component signal transduction system YycFG [Caldanaerobacter subterraneus subsp. tengcongensis MB4]